MDRPVTVEKKLLREMELYFGKDIRRIEHAKKVLGFAREILKSKAGFEGINETVVIAASILHDIGIHACEKKYGSTSGQLQEKEGPSIARHIMEKLNMEEKVIEETCQIIAHHHSPGIINTLNFKILYDVDCLVNKSSP